MGERESADGRIGRNDPCYCGSGQKFKRCHGRDEYRQEQFAKSLDEQVAAGWRIESQSDRRAVVTRRQWGIVGRRRIIEVSEYGKVSIDRL